MVAGCSGRAGLAGLHPLDVCTADLDRAQRQDQHARVGQAADAATMLTAALFVALVVSWLADAASRSDALELDHRGPSRPQLSRSVPVPISVLSTVAAVVMTVLVALATSEA